MENKEFLGTERIGKLLFKLALPSVVAQLVNLLYNMVDRVYIGHMENVEVVHDKLMVLGGKLVLETVDAILNVT